jgi:hypothetical protein
LCCLTCCLLMHVGTVGAIDAVTFIISFVVIVVVVITLEWLIGLLHKVVFETPFQDIITVMLTELMIVGFISLTFKVIFATTDSIATKWVHGLEFAEITISFTAFNHCIVGGLLIMYISQHLNNWGKISRSHISDILHDFILTVKSMHTRFYWFPFQLLQNIEFRMLNNFFCSIYHINKKTFDFEAYVKHCFTKFLFELVEISMFNWAIVFVILSLNLAGYELGLQPYPCHTSGVEHAAAAYNDTAHAVGTGTGGGGLDVVSEAGAAYAPRRLSGGDDDAPVDEQYELCVLNRNLAIFTSAGIVIFLLTLILAVCSRVYHLRLLGITRFDDYADKLQASEEADLRLEERARSEGSAKRPGHGSPDLAAAHQEEEDVLNERDLKAAVERVKALRERRELAERSHAGATRHFLRFERWVNSMTVWVESHSPDSSGIQDGIFGAIFSRRGSTNTSLKYAAADDPPAGAAPAHGKAGGRAAAMNRRRTNVVMGGVSFEGGSAKQRSHHRGSDRSREAGGGGGGGGPAAATAAAKSGRVVPVDSSGVIKAGMLPPISAAPAAPPPPAAVPGSPPGQERAEPRDMLLEYSSDEEEGAGDDRDRCGPTRPGHTRLTADYS